MKKRMIAVWCVMILIASMLTVASAADTPALSCVMDSDKKGGQLNLSGVASPIYAVQLSLTTDAPGEYEFYPNENGASKTVKSRTENKVTTVTVYVDSKSPLDKDANGNIPLGRLTSANAFTGGGTAELVLVNKGLEGKRYTNVKITYTTKPSESNTNGTVTSTAATPAPTPGPAARFTDVAGHWALEPINFVVGNRLFNGMSDTTFEPDTPMTRAMFVMVLSRFGTVIGDQWKVVNDSPASFSDVTPDQWYAGAVYWAGGTGIVNGIGDGEFGPDQAITREQMAVMIVNFTRLCGKSLPETADASAFTDAGSISGWAAEAVVKTQRSGLLNGRPEGNFDPQATATRAEVATLMLRLVRL